MPNNYVVVVIHEYDVCAESGNDAVEIVAQGLCCDSNSRYCGMKIMLKEVSNGKLQN